MSLLSQAPPKPVTFPGTFRADNGYRLGAVTFILIGLASLALALVYHQAKSIPVLAIPFVLFSVVFLTIMTLKVEVDETGLRQQSILGRREAVWDQIQRMELSQVYALYGSDGREAIWMSLLPMRVQEAISAEALRQTDLRPSNKALKRPVVKEWTRR